MSDNRRRKAQCNTYEHAWLRMRIIRRMRLCVTPPESLATGSELHGYPVVENAKAIGGSETTPI